MSKSPAEFFDRRVVSREMMPDGCEEIKLECGHEVVLVNPTEIKEATMPCAGCVNDWVDQRRAKRREKRSGCGE